MNDALRYVLAKAYAVPERAFVWVNFAVAAFVALAHGGALAVTYAKPTPEASEIRELASISLPLAAAIIATGVVALAYSNLRLKVLALHGAVLLAAEGFMFLWALDVLLTGLPQGHFSWQVGFMSASMFYAVLLFCRFSVPQRMRSTWGVRYAPVIALACAVPVDIGVVVRVVA